MTDRASLAELLEFANKVREAGGGNPLSALMPAVPEDSSQCLIARNLNFNCHVNGADWGLPDGPWYMYVNDGGVAQHIAEALDLTVTELPPDSGSRQWAIALPDRIGKVAADFDQALNIAMRVSRYDVACETEDDLTLLREMGPYIDQATIETYDLARIIHPDGSVTI